MNKKEIKQLQRMEKNGQLCPKCGSVDIWKSGFAIRTDGKVQVYQCKNCGSKFRDVNNE